MNEDKAGKTYWDQTYEITALPRAFDPGPSTLRNYSKHQFHSYFRQVLGPLHGAAVLEIGCGASSFLPYFAKEFGMRISGIDYSEAGCNVVSRMLARDGIAGEIVCADVFCPPACMMDRFDVVISFGVAEHFTNTSACIEAFARFLRPGGLMITVIPNLAGLAGFVQRGLDRRVFDKHIVLDTSLLSRAHQDSGLRVDTSAYFQFCNFGVLNINEVPSNSVQYYLKRPALICLHAVTAAVWMLERLLPHRLSPNRITSPYVVCTAYKPAATHSEGEKD